MTRQTLDADERRSERRMIIDGGADGGMWPHFPVLPVKRYSENELEAGIIAWRYLPPDVEDRSVRVYLANLPELAIAAAARERETGEKVTYAEALDGMGSIEYATLDAFFDDGWMID